MTISFDPASNRWKSRYSYDSSCFDSQDNVMLSFNTSTTGEDVCYTHSPNSPKNTFYGLQTDSQIKLSFNANPSNNKVYKALSLEGANLNVATSQLTTNLSPDLPQRNDARSYEGFREKGGIFYGGVTKVQSTDNENGLKLVGEIIGANVLVINAAEQPNINNGIWPFNTVNFDDPWWEYIYFTLLPYPHYRSLDSATSEDMISKYYIGIEVNGQISVRPFRANAFTDEFGAFNGSLTSDNIAAGALQNSTLQTYDLLDDSVYNTNTPPKLAGNIIAARVRESVITNTSNLEDFRAASIGLAAGINNHLAGGGDGRLFLYKITDDRIDGSDPIGQYADLTLNLGSRDFELFAVNADYSQTSLDHSN